ncbi:AAA family ATPase [Nocardia cyriacigeorgica]|uniref:ATP-dependent Clp protease ATP-binding subunit n=1 Tax=Nocardia cyriacigeorgica TaxID=135487 RepID=A0A5R8NMQ0_9NOCA|nr:AAA family ATPase [Nocardia cyriacigeorgica]TLF76804.1 ATP-dependent Clp protease ATP-binding subunit [Nocardia cyriacigeorgica]
MPFLTDMLQDQNRAPAAPARPDSATGFDRQALAARLGESVLGQADAIDAVVRAVTLAHVGATDPHGPLASVLLAGPTGVGKTELVRRLAAELRSGPDDLCRVDMNALAQEHYAASFSGAPPGYAGSKESLTLFDRDTVEGTTYRPGIVLFDEIEKADVTVLRALLHVLDTGELRLANGKERISFRNCYVFMTSNLGSAQWVHRRTRRWWPSMPRVRADNGARQRELTLEAVQRFLDPEFFNRIDEIVVLNPITADTARRIARLEIDRLAARLRRRGVHLTCADSVIDMLAVEGFDAQYGARSMRRRIRCRVAAPIADAIVHHRTGGEPLSLSAAVRDGRVLVYRIDEVD